MYPITQNFKKSFDAKFSLYHFWSAVAAFLVQHVIRSSMSYFNVAKSTFWHQIKFFLCSGHIK